MRPTIRSIAASTMCAGPGLSRLILGFSLLAFLPAATVAQEAVQITTGNWQIKKPSKDFKDLPTLMPKDQNGWDIGFRLLDFVCMKSNYYMLLLQPSIKLRDTEPATISIRSARAPGSPPMPLTFQNLYKTKGPLSRRLDWDADIHYAELNPALVTLLKTASDMELTLAGRTYVLELSDLGPRFGSFQQFCEKGIVDDAAHFEER